MNDVKINDLNSAEMVKIDSNRRQELFVETIKTLLNVTAVSEHEAIRPVTDEQCVERIHRNKHGKKMSIISKTITASPCKKKMPKAKL